MRPLASHLIDQQCVTATLVPTWYLQSLPLHAAPINDTFDCLSDLMPVAYLPAAAFGFTEEENSRRRDVERQFVGVADEDLEGAQKEAVLAWSSYRGTATAVFGSAGSRKFVLESLQGASNLHLGCHASISDDAWGANLHLHDGQVTINELLMRPRNRNLGLIVVAACDSGHHDRSLSPDEAVSLSTCLLDYGASVVVTSLWPVDDHATSLMMSKFYEARHDQNLSVAEALQAAMQWLRTSTLREVRKAESIERRVLAAKHSTSTKREARGRVLSHRASFTKLRGLIRPYAHPYYWAGWTATGSLED